LMTWREMWSSRVATHRAAAANVVRARGRESRGGRPAVDAPPPLRVVVVVAVAPVPITVTVAARVLFLFRRGVKPERILPVRAVVDASSVLPPRRHRERLHLQRHRRLAHRLSLIGG